LGYFKFFNYIGTFDTRDHSSSCKQYIALNFLTISLNILIKQTFIFLALVDAHYRFIAFDIGEYSRNNDAVPFVNSKLSKILEKNKLNVSKDNELLNTQTMPYISCHRR